jgi:hypothetical protein
MGWVDTSAGPGRPGISTATVLAPAGPFPALFEVTSTAVPQWASLLVLMGLTGCAAAGGLRLYRHSQQTDSDLHLGAQLGIGLVPVMALGSLALLGIPVYFAGRAESMVWGLAVALAAILVSGLPPLVRWICIGTYSIIGAATIGLWLADLPIRPQAPGVEVGQWLAPMLEEGDRVVVFGLWQLEIEHGLARAWPVSSNGDPTPAQVLTLPRSQAEHPGWFDRIAAVSNSIVDEARVLEHEQRQRGGRIWLLWSPAQHMEHIWSSVFRGWRYMRIANSPVIAVELFVPPTVFEEAR